MPVSKRTGRRYTEGSHTTLDGYPRVCASGEKCLHGGKVVMSGPHGLWFETVPPGPPRSWHFDCRKALGL